MFLYKTLTRAKWTVFVLMFLCYCGYRASRKAFSNVKHSINLPYCPAPFTVKYLNGYKCMDGETNVVCSLDNDVDTVLCDSWFGDAATTEKALGLSGNVVRADGAAQLAEALLYNQSFYSTVQLVFISRVYCKFILTD